MTEMLVTYFIVSTVPLNNADKKTLAVDVPLL
jgi:hypothetical protein